MKFVYKAALLVGLTLCACSDINLPGSISLPQETAYPTSTSVPDVEVIETPQGSPTPGEPLTLRVWLPPEFGPGAGTAAEMLQERLDEFSERKQDLWIDVRIKNVEGAGGLLDSLSTTSAAAPLALPDVVALPHADMVTAAENKVLLPVGHFEELLRDSDWYDYARQMAQVQGNSYGLPFAGNALVLAYRPGVVANPPSDWNGVINTTMPVVFPAADPQALFTLAQYQAEGGEVQDDEGHPFLDEDILAEVLTFYRDAEQTGVMPYWLTQYQDDAQVWKAFLERRADLIVAQSLGYLGEGLKDNAIAHIPTSEGTPYTLASGWIWVVPAHQPERIELAIELTEFLIESSYMGGWSEAAGYLPTRPSALENWTNTALQPVVDLISSTAQVFPASEILDSLGQVLATAVGEVLNRQAEPQEAAREAVEALTGP